MSTPRRPLTPKQPQAFALHTLFVVVLLSLVSVPYAFFFQSVGNSFFSSLGGGREVHYARIPLEAEAGGADTLITGHLTQPSDPPPEGPAWEVAFDADAHGYRPTALLIALLVATPMSLRRRIVALATGPLALNIVFVAQTAMVGLGLFAAAGPEGSAGVSALPLLLAVAQSGILPWVLVLGAWIVLAQPARGIDFGEVTARLGKWIGRPPGKPMGNTRS